MAVTFKSVSALVSGTTVFSIDMTPVSSVASGDMLLLFHTTRSSDTVTPDTPAGWSKINSVFVWSGTSRYTVFYRIADGSANDAPTVTTGTAISQSAHMMCVTGQSRTIPVITDYRMSNVDSGTLLHGSIASLYPGSLAVIAGASYLSETGTWTFRNGFTSRFTTSSGPAHYAATKEISVGGIGLTEVSNSTTLLRTGVITLIIPPERTQRRKLLKISAPPSGNRRRRLLIGA